MGQQPTPFKRTSGRNVAEVRRPRQVKPETARRKAYRLRKEAAAAPVVVQPEPVIVEEADGDQD